MPKKLNTPALAVHFGISRQAMWRQLKNPDAPLPDDAGRYDVGAVAAFRADMAELDKAAYSPVYYEAMAQLRETKAKLAAWKKAHR